MEHVINQTQKLSFSVIKKNGKKFFAVFVKRITDIKEKFYDCAIYFESLSVDVLPIDGKVEIYRADEIIDQCNIQLIGPGGREDMGPEFTFKKFKKSSDKMYLNVKNLKVGDRVTVDWKLSEKEFEEIKYFIEHQDLAGAIKIEDIPMYVEEYFVGRIGFHQDVKPFIFPFTLFCSVLGGYHG